MKKSAIRGKANTNRIAKTAIGTPIYRTVRPYEKVPETLQFNGVNLKLESARVKSDLSVFCVYRRI